MVSKNKTSLPSLSSLGINNSSILYQLSADALHKITLQSNQGVETSSVRKRIFCNIPVIFIGQIKKGLLGQ